MAGSKPELTAAEAGGKQISKEGLRVQGKACNEGPGHWTSLVFECVFDPILRNITTN